MTSTLSEPYLRPNPTPRYSQPRGIGLNFPSPLSLSKENETWTIRKSVAAANAAFKYGMPISAASARKDERLRVSLRLRILIAALLVGFFVSFTPSQAVAPTMNLKLWANTYPKEYALKLVLQQWSSKAQYACLVNLWERESHWNYLAHNKSSGAFGIAQFMPQTWGNYKLPYKPKDASIQITGGLRYIYKRYGTPCSAWAFWQKQAKRGNPWY